MTLDELAAGAGVFVGVLRQVMVGRTPGYKITPKVDEFIAHYEATHKPEPFFKPFEELNVK
jgi:hypothetical protein